MKSTHLPLKKQATESRTVYKQLRYTHNQSQPRTHVPPRLRIVQSTKAGRVRGGHSFH